MPDWLTELFDGPGSPLLDLCRTLYPWAFPIEVAADALIALAYWAIPLGLVIFVRNRRDLVFSWVFWLIVFVAACGTGHALHPAQYAWPWLYPVVVVEKAFTALVSVGAAWVLFVMVLPAAREVPSLKGLQDALKAMRIEHREDLQRLRATYESASVGIAEVDRDGRFLRVNDCFCHLLGRDKADLLGRPLFAFVGPEDVDEVRALFERQMRGELPHVHYEKRYVRGDGSVLWAEVSATTVDDEQGRPQYGIRILRDVTERKQAQDRQLTMLHELDHRVRNTLAIVQSVATHTLRQAHVDQAVIESLAGRLLALADAHAILSEGSWRGGDLATVVERTLAAHDRIDRHGPPVPLASAQVVTASLVLHELASNAAKYGSLSNATGRVDLAWRFDEGALDLTWREHGGPPVRPPDRRGLGSRLIERLLSAERAAFDIQYPPTGVEASIRLPLTRGAMAHA